MPESGTTYGDSPSQKIDQEGLEMDIESIRRVVLSRHLYELAAGSLRSFNDMHLFAAANLMHDSVEAFLVGLADHLQCEADQNTRFDRYFVLINEKIAPKELPFKAKLLRLNRIRIDSKHHGIQPSRDECDRMLVAVREFFDEASLSIFGRSFASISAIDLLRDGDAKELLHKAQEALAADDHETCAIACREALYCEIEFRYDISSFKNGRLSRLLAGLASSAPHFARNNEYIEENVREPTDYIVYDHARVNELLLLSGADNTAFWNVFRLTPEVFRKAGGQWVVKHDFAKLAPEVLADKVEYIFSATLDVVLSMHTAAQATQTGAHGRYHLTLLREQVPVYSKADTRSEVKAHTPLGLKRLDTDYRVEGLQGDGPYWHVCHWDEEVSLKGFIHADEVE